MRPGRILPLVCVPLFFLPAHTESQAPVGPPMTTVFTIQEADALAWDARIVAMERGDDLQRALLQEDALAPGWLHERFQQRYRGLRVFGAELIRHWHDGRVAAVNGTYYEAVSADTTPGIGAEQARLAAERAAGGHATGSAELLIYPVEGRFVLAYQVHVRTRDDLFLLFIDARTGTVTDRWSDRRTQVPVVGRGTGTWQDAKKISTTEQDRAFFARDGLRPAVSATVDVQGNFDAWNYYAIDPETSAARDQDNDWQDGAVVDAHVYAGWTYDYYYKRFGRRGLDDANRPVASYVHYWPRSAGLYPPLTFNAFWDPVDKSVNYGDGDGKLFNYFSSALDVVTHELTHGVTQFTSDLVYRDESGALDEAFSDIMATGAEFFFEPRGFGRQRAEWAAGEDLFMESFVGDQWYATRYFPNPAALEDPDHYSIRYTGREDNGGVHTNSLIPSHAFYLFVEGGTNRTSGIQVQGIGFSNIEKAEKIFYRAFTSYLVPTSRFADARRATLQSARDLYGAGSREEEQMALAWTAVGVQ